ncbi:hypothetical protein CC80DRAFT_282118 [Byssothecium circinans]|uniref:Uncharacterized protein n=1 Tax=Byssothecium circinans TaxID=147558 RepID=A0A6A5T9U1_9PLEO|nr:hypothetical protein CC80DRAFT_282118 [Byssothecium circinans]
MGSSSCHPTFTLPQCQHASLPATLNVSQRHCQPTSPSTNLTVNLPHCRPSSPSTTFTVDHYYLTVGHLHWSPSLSTTHTCLSFEPAMALKPSYTKKKKTKTKTKQKKKNIHLHLWSHAKVEVIRSRPSRPAVAVAHAYAGGWTAGWFVAWNTHTHTHTHTHTWSREGHWSREGTLQVADSRPGILAFELVSGQW